MAKTTGDTCTFCGRSSRDVNLLINGISGCICDDCARQAYEIVKEQTGGKKTSFGLICRYRCTTITSVYFKRLPPMM